MHDNKNECFYLTAPNDVQGLRHNNDRNDCPGTFRSLMWLWKEWIAGSMQYAHDLHDVRQRGTRVPQSCAWPMLVALRPDVFALSALLVPCVE
eukprot:860557-Amphidinium_carterae.2